MTKRHINMKVDLHSGTVKHLLPICEELGLSPSQVIKMLSQAYNNHINKGQPLKLQGVIYEERQEEKHTV